MKGSWTKKTGRRLALCGYSEWSERKWVCNKAAEANSGQIT